MREKLKAIRNAILAAPFKLLGLVVGLLYRIMRPIFHSVYFLIAVLIFGLLLGFAVGTRVDETGWAGAIGGDLKGANVKVSGPCRVDGEVRPQAIAEDEVKVVSIDEKRLIGIVRATREVIECDIETTAVDRLPLLRDLWTAPAAVPEIRIIERKQFDQEVADLHKRTIRASGTCSKVDGTDVEPFIDQDIEVINVERSATDKSVIKIDGIMKRSKTTVSCTNKTIKYSILNGSTELVVQGLPEGKKDIVGEIIMVNAMCFPDKRLPPSKKNKTVFYPLVDARMKVVQATFDLDNKLQYLAGVVIENGALVECDNARYPIIWKPYDDRIKLAPIKGSVETIEEEQMERAVPSQIESQSDAR